MHPTKALPLLLCALALAGCSKYLPKLDEVIPDRSTEYRKSESLPDLEVPPDLSTEAIQDTMAVPDVDEAGTATYSSYQERVAARRQARELGLEDANAIQALADEQVIVVGGSAAVIWPDLGAFWAEEGFELDLDDPELGIVETEWRSSPTDLTREKFKVFAEPGEAPGTTVLYLSHVSEAQAPEGEELVWQAQPRNPALEAEVAGRLRARLGGAPLTPAAPATAAATEATEATAATAATAGAAATATASPAGSGAAGGEAELVSAGAGRLYLRVPQDFAGAWRDTGAALDRAGFRIVESDRARGLYYVRHTPQQDGEGKKGLMSRLAFWKGDEQDYQLSLTGVGDKTEIVVLDKDGDWDASPGAAEILQALQTALNNPG